MHARSFGFLGYRFLRLLLRPDEQDLPAVSGQVSHEDVRLLDARERLLEVDDVDAVALHEDEALHLRIPTARLVPEMDTRLEQLLHGDDGHGDSPFCSSASVNSLRSERAPGGAIGGSEPIGKRA